MSAISTQKDLLRRFVRDKKNVLTADAKQNQAQFIFNQIELMPEFAMARKIAIYWALPDEVPTQLFIDKWYLEKEIYLPAIVNQNMVLKLYSGRHCLARDSQFGIMEPNGKELNKPADLDLLIVPGVAFNSLGFRLGRGGGYYDRLLNTQPSTLKIGVAFDVQKIDIVPTEPHDVIMDRVFFGK